MLSLGSTLLVTLRHELLNGGTFGLNHSICTDVKIFFWEYYSIVIIDLHWHCWVAKL